MIQTKCKAVLFDLDGTLVNTLTDLGNAINAPLVAKGFDALPNERVQSLVGNGLVNALHNALNEYNMDTNGVAFDEYFHILMDFYRAHPVDQSRPYEGICEMLKNLRAPYGILSNKDDALVQKIVATLFPDFPFVSVFGLRQEFPRKPDPFGVIEFAEKLHIQPSEILYVGDSEVDVKTADAAGSPCLLCSWGFRKREALEALNCPIVDDAHELFTSIHQIIR